MARGPLSTETKLKRALEAAAAAFGADVITQVEPSAENATELAREAESVLLYFKVRGEGFKQKECLKCGLVFAYSWHIDGISYCSLDCCKKALKEIGLDWDPTRPQHLRWGQFAPAIVPPNALSML